MELSQPLIIVILAASGYCFCNWCNALKYDILRDTGQRLYLTAALCGATLYIATFFIYEMQRWLWVDTLKLHPIFEINISIESYIAQLSLAVSLFLTILLNLSDQLKYWTLERVWRKNDIDHLCIEAASGLKPVSVTLDNRKAYIGIIVDSLEPGKEANLTILPLYSGYRDKDTLEMHLTRKYTSVDSLLERISSDEEPDDEVIPKLNEYRLVIPRSRIVTINLSVNSLHNNIVHPERSF